MGRKKKGKKSGGGGGAPPPPHQPSIPPKKEEKETITMKKHEQEEENPPKNVVVDDTNETKKCCDDTTKAALAAVLMTAAADTATSSTTSTTTSPSAATTTSINTIKNGSDSVAISSAAESAAAACCNIFDGSSRGDDDDAATKKKVVSKSIATTETTTAELCEKKPDIQKDSPQQQKQQKQEQASSSSKSSGSCCGGGKKDSSGGAATKTETNTSLSSTASTTTPATEPATTNSLVVESPPPKKKGSCCSSSNSSNQQKAAAPPMQQANTCTGCGDNCQCCVENGWSYCQCGPNCRCSNPLMVEQASLVLESTGHHNNFQPTSTTTTTSMMIEDPLKSIATTSDIATTTGLGNAVPDLEAPEKQKQKQKQQQRRPLFVDIVVGGMTCTMCSQAITRALNGMVGIVSGVTVSLSTDVAHIELDPSQDDHYARVVEDIQDLISDIGYMVVDVIPMPNKSLDAVAEPTTGSGSGGTNATTATNGNGGNNNDQLRSPLLGNDDDIESNNANGNRSDNNTQQDRWNRIAQRQEEKLFQRKRAFLLSLIGTIPILLLTMILPHILPHAMRWWERHNVHILPHNKSIPLVSLLLWILATPVQFVCGWEFYKSSYYGLFRTGTMGMDVLVVLGTTASYGYALYATLSDQMKESHFFETSAVLICFVLLGKWMQALAVHRTSDALSQLMQLQPSTAIRVKPINHNDDDAGASSSLSGNAHWDPMKQPYREEVIPTKQLQQGDIVKIVPGASLPADGVVLAGELSVDESMVTGESLPVLKTKSSVVLGGTVCVESTGSMDYARQPSPDGSGTGNVEVPQTAGQVAFCQVTGVGSSTALAQIIQLVQDAQASKVPMQNFADSVSAIFVPVVATLSIITFLVWYALCSSGVVPEEWYTKMNEDAATFSLMFGIACLVISCPCALGLATPTAVMVGTGMGAQLGILMKGGEALEAASKVNAVVLDKTGTLTTGKPVVTDFILLKKGGSGGCCSSKKKDAPSMADGKPLSRETILWLLGSLERSSEHPLAKAIVSYVEEELSVKKKGSSYLEEKPFLQPTEFRSMTGRGASGYLQTNSNDANQHFVAVGNRAFFSSLEVELTVEIDDQMKELEEQGKTAILAAINYQFYVILGVADELKPDAAAAVAYLRNEMKIEVWMVTGDNARTAQAIARQLDLPSQRVVSEALPNAKVHQVKKLQQQGKTVAHVGDGINDSPALAQANVGISVGTGAAIAAEASDMVLVRGQYVADVCTALDLCRVIFARIQWNFLWSLVYNCLGIPLAAGVCFPIFHTRLPPTVAALAMALSSVSVVFSSLALRLYKPPSLENYSARLVGMSTSTSSGSGNADTASAPPAAAGASNATASPPSQPARTGRGPQLVTRLSLDLGPGPSSELAQPLLANQRATTGPQDAAAVSMEEGSQPSL